MGVSYDPLTSVKISSPLTQNHYVCIASTLRNLVMNKRKIRSMLHYFHSQITLCLSNISCSYSHQYTMSTVNLSLGQRGELCIFLATTYVWPFSLICCTGQEHFENKSQYTMLHIVLPNPQHSANPGKFQCKALYKVHCIL